jgi:uncharacterized membrane protein
MEDSREARPETPGMEHKHLRDFFSAEQQDAIVDAIRRAEAGTSGQIRVRLEVRAGNDIAGAARRAFQKLDMGRTRLRNGVLFYLAVEDRKFLILGDEGIYHQVPADFWDAITAEVLEAFQEDRCAEGLVLGIERAGEQLARLFPALPDATNELPDDISIAGDTQALPRIDPSRLPPR